MAVQQFDHQYLHGNQQTHLAVGDFVIDRDRERLLGPQGPVRLGNKAFRVLLQLAEQEGRLLTKEALFSSVWDGTIVSESALTSVIKELRRALGDASRTPRYIESVYGRGYRLLLPPMEVVKVDGPLHSGKPGKPKFRTVQRDGKRVRLRVLDADGPSFTADLQASFAANVRRARNENRTLDRD